jgi:hypothetical protein
MRFVTLCTVVVAVLTLAIHGVFASSVDTVKHTDQVNQGLSYLSKMEETTCALEDRAKSFSLESKERLYTILTKLYGSNDGCEITNSLLRFAIGGKLSKFPGKESHIGNKSSSGSSPNLMPTGKYSDRISSKEDELPYLLSPLGPKLVKLFIKMVDKDVEPKFIIKIFKKRYSDPFSIFLLYYCWWQS